MQEMNLILERFKNKRILVLGDVGVDVYTWGIVERISPEAPVPVVQVKNRTKKLAMAANVAENLQALGANCTLISVVGSDEQALVFRQLCHIAGIDAQKVYSFGLAKTIVKERIIGLNQQLLRVDDEDCKPLSGELQKNIFHACIECIHQGVDAILLEDYAKGFFSEELLQNIIQYAQKNNILVAIDPNFHTPFYYYQGADLLTPNLKEAEALAQLKIVDMNTLYEAGQKLMQSLHLKMLAITRGKDGVTLFTIQDEQIVMKTFPTVAREVFDVSGAGDTFISVMVLGLVSHATCEEAVIIANVAAGIEVSKMGTAIVSLEELQVACSQLNGLTLLMN